MARVTLADTIARPNGKRAAFIPFVTAGDPSLDATRRFVRVLREAGADIVELGVPFSDPVADGPVIQAAAQRALERGTSLAGVLKALRGLRASGERVPVILFTYLNPALRLGPARFAAEAARAGAQGALLVDLPAEEAEPWRRALAGRGLELVLLASPTTSDARLRLIGRKGGSIVYYVSREGVTGARRSLPAGLAARIARVRRLTGKPLIVGFGISGGRQARALAGHADGVVVGSALVAAAAGKGAAAGARAIRRVAPDVLRGLRC
ncbi:MAG: tryptophan synthase subunit alpha [Elusimicrobia bacterium]|nr:tryptophan synthase subunit alpha [Elusimicrobiota bacterium]